MSRDVCRRAAVFAAAFIICGVCGAARAREDDTSEAGIRAALARELAFDYAETDLTEVLRDIRGRAGVELVVDPAAIECKGNTPITWSSKRSPVERALRWVTRLSDLGFRIEDGAVFISTRENLRGEVSLRVYDIRDLVQVSYEEGRPGPRVAFSPLEAGRYETEEVLTPASMAEMVMSRLRPDEWAAELGTSVEERDGLLIVMQRPDVHALIEQLIADMRAARRRPVRVEVVVVAASAVAPVARKAEGGTLTPDELRAVIARAEDRVMAHGELSTLDGRTAHVVWGAKRHYVESKVLAWPEARVGYGGWSPDRIEHEVIPYGAGGSDGESTPKVLVVKTPAPRPAPPPPGEGVLVPVVDALLDGVLVEATPRLLESAAGEPQAAELDLRVVISHPRDVPETAARATLDDVGISLPTVDYSRLATTARVPVGAFSLVGRMAVRRGAADVPAVVLALVAVPSRPGR